MLEVMNDQMNGIQLGRHIDEYGGKRKVKKKVMRCILDEQDRIMTLDSYDVKECKINGELVQSSNFDEFLKKHPPSLHGGTVYAFFKHNLVVYWNSEVREKIQVRIYHETDREFMETRCLPSVCRESERLEARSKEMSKDVNDNSV